MQQVQTIQLLIQFKSLLEEICNIINITITKISTPKELFILDLMNHN